jgi:hypothetical protein
MKNTLPVRRLVPAMTEDEAFDLTNKPTLLTRNDVDHIVTTTEIGRLSDGKLIYLFVKDVIPYHFCVSAFPVLLNAANATVIGGNRAIAAGAYMEPQILKDGSRGKRNVVPDLPHLRGAKNGVIGFYDKPQCRLTSFAAHYWEEFQETWPLIRRVNEVFREYLPEQYANQAEAASRIDSRYVIADSVFSTVTVNRNFQTAVHIDEGDLHSGFGALTILTAGTFSGGELVFPQFRIGVDFKMQDVLLADVHQPHGNLPIVGVKDEYERVSLVLYFRESMLWKCPAARL